MPNDYLKKNKIIKKNLYKNQFKFVTAFEIYNSLVYLSNPIVVLFSIIYI